MAALSIRSHLKADVYTQRENYVRRIRFPTILNRNWPAINFKAKDLAICGLTVFRYKTNFLMCQTKSNATNPAQTNALYKQTISTHKYKYYRSFKKWFCCFTHSFEHVNSFTFEKRNSP